MSESDRRKFFRVLFEANFEVRAAEWSDKEATGLDISLNGCRFNCKQALSDGEIINIVFKPGIELEGIVRWCWPIEWYFQAALHFEDITEENQNILKSYIEDVTGENYQMQKDEQKNQGANVESVEILEGDLDSVDHDLSASIIDEGDQLDLHVNRTEEDALDELQPLEEEDLLNLDIEKPISSGSDFPGTVEDLEDLPENDTEEDALDELQPLAEEDLLNLDIEEPIDSGSDFVNTIQDDEIFHELDEGDISTLSSVGKQVVLYDLVKDQAELLSKYLSDRAGMEVEYVTKKENLWRLLKIDSIDLVIIETGVEVDLDSLEVMQQTKDQFPEILFICISGPVSLERRLQFLNAGALDYLTRPLHLSTIAQSVLVHLRHSLVGDFAEDISPQEGMMASNAELQEKLALITEQRDKARVDANTNASERDEAIAETQELERRAQELAEEKESLYLEETFIPEGEEIEDSDDKHPVDDPNSATDLLDEDLKIAEEVDLIEEDY